ncbi:MAG: hypothetical protein HGGPFJEG_01172 [Ignavibacteria bacterium]|nr:hypothetical protein [Ignavibacteria bacterium]
MKKIDKIKPEKHDSLNTHLMTVVYYFLLAIDKIAHAIPYPIK